LECALLLLLETEADDEEDEEDDTDELLVLVLSELSCVLAADNGDALVGIRVTSQISISSQL
jgi:hypothetical protein